MSKLPKYYKIHSDGCTVELEPIYEELAHVQHGRWLPQVVLGQKAWDCSECKTLGSQHWKWCPVCGAKMDGDEND